MILFLIFLSLVFLVVIGTSIILYMVRSTKKIKILKKEISDEMKIIK